MWGYRVQGTSYRVGSKVEAIQKLADYLCKSLRETKALIGEQVDGDPNESKRFVVMGKAAAHHRAYLLEFA